MKVFWFSIVGCFIYAWNTNKKLLSDKYVFSTLEKMTNDIDQVSSLMMARQEETQHQG